MRIGDTNIHADRFVGTASTVLLTHYHRDHLYGIRRGLRCPRVLCSPLTARLLTEIEGVDPTRVQRIGPGERRELLDGSRTMAVTGIEANHCPGSLMFLLEWNGSRALYTGDFRLDDALRVKLSGVPDLDLLYLDATYDDSRYKFPSQEEAIEDVISLLRRREGRRVYIAIYTIGKNRVLQGAFREFGLPFYTTKDKRRVYDLVGMGHLVTDDRNATPFRAYARGYLEHYFRMTKEFRRGECLVIIPTGWAVDQPESPQCHYVPYSEHCDYSELQEFRKLVRAKRTVKLHG